MMHDQCQYYHNYNYSNNKKYLCSTQSTTCPPTLIVTFKHGAILYNKAEVFSLSIRNPNGRPMLQFDWLIHSGLILARSRCLKILQSDRV